ncbi:MAG: hypothetical protein U0325_18815 [Polyangiales bacterium]
MKTRLAVLMLCAADLAAFEARAYRLNVVAATELRMDPAVPAGSTALTVRARLRDDRGTPLARRALTLTLRPAGAPELTRELRTDERGEAVMTHDVGRARRVAVTGAWPGDGTAASARASIDVDFDAPFVTPELMLPGEGVTLGDGPLSAILTVRIGEVQTLSPAGLAVQLARVADGVQGSMALASGVTDGTGRVVLEVPLAALGRPGVARLMPRVDLGNGRVIDGVGRELLVRGRAAVSLLRREVGDESDGVALHGAVVLSTGAAVPNAALRIVQGERTLAATRADAQGAFQVALGPEVLTEPGMTARAVFEPTEPWYLAAESPEVQLTAPPTPPIHWSWGAAPLALAALVIGAMTLRRRAVRAPEPPPAPPPQADHVAVVNEGLAGPRPCGWWWWIARPGRGCPGVACGSMMARGRASARRRSRWPTGPRRVSSRWRPRGTPRDGCAWTPRSEVRVQVAMRTGARSCSRESVRGWRRAAGRGVADAAGARAGGAEAHVAPLAKLVEEGCYGPATPGPTELDAADALVETTRAKAPAPRLDRR